MSDNLDTPTITPAIVAKNIPIAETKIVFNKPTKNALPYEREPSYSIIEKVISNDASWFKKPNPKDIPLLPMLIWALVAKYIITDSKAKTVIAWGIKSLAFLFSILNFLKIIFLRIKKRARLIQPFLILLAIILLVVRKEFHL